MKIRFNREKLEKAIYDFYNATGVKLAILDANFSSIASLECAPYFCHLIHQYDSGEKRCLFSDQEILSRCSKSLLPEMHICHAGLVDVALPIIHRENIMGYIIMGQMRRNVPFEEIEEKLMWMSEYKDALKNSYSEMVIYDDKKMESIAKLAIMLASYIMTEDMINADYSLFTENVIAYIRKNLNKTLCVENICKALGTSKNTLYRHFRTHIGMSVNEYILHERILLAKKLLKDDDISISDICEKTGVSNPSYFCKLFKQKTGVTPIKYRRENT